MFYLYDDSVAAVDAGVARRVGYVSPPLRMVEHRAVTRCVSCDASRCACACVAGCTLVSAASMRTGRRGCLAWRRATASGRSSTVDGASARPPGGLMTTNKTAVQQLGPLRSGAVAIEVAAQPVTREMSTLGSWFDGCVRQGHNSVIAQGPYPDKAAAIGVPDLGRAKISCATGGCAGRGNTPLNYGIGHIGPLFAGRVRLC